MSYLFSSKIRCLDCGKNYRGKTERKNKLYICSTYTKSGKCYRFQIKENELLDVVDKHINLFNIITNDKLEYVREITVKEKTITIYYTDLTQSTLSANHIIY